MNNASPVYLKGKLVDMLSLFMQLLLRYIYQQKDIKVEYHQIRFLFSVKKFDNNPLEGIIKFA